MSIGPNDVTPHYPKLADCLVSTTEHPDPEIAYALATCSGYAYAHANGRADTRTVATMMARMGLLENRCHAIERSIDSMYIDSTVFLIQSHDGEVVILCYRGSEVFDFVDWLSDFDVEPEIYTFHFRGAEQSANVHSGWFRGARATYDDVATALKRAWRGESVAEEDADARLGKKMKALYITGHSLGGAVGLLTAVLLKQEDDDEELREIASTLKAVYTYGQPMIGSPKFAAQCQQMDGFFDRNVVRYIHRRDVVPHVPPGAAGPFEHFGQEWVYRPNGSKPGEKSPSQEWTLDTRRTGQANLIEFPLLPFLVDYTGRRSPVGRNLIQGWNKLAGTVDGRISDAAERIPMVGQYLVPPFVYSIEDHAPHHYVAKLATPGVMNEFR
ncbi:hypothetical protein [Streptomyces sp. NPDC056628]|uniref:lipase family protein n=1 Tax=Streptomyces sp. NPDC056628 TaxID=3345882 RepID=UPI0036D1BA6A